MTREEALEVALLKVIEIASECHLRCWGEKGDGRIDAAEAALAMPKDVPGMRLIPHTSEDCDCCEVAHEERARLLCVAEAVLEAAAEYINTHTVDLNSGKVMTQTVPWKDSVRGPLADALLHINLAAIVEGVK